MGPLCSFLLGRYRSGLNLLNWFLLRCVLDSSHVIAGQSLLTVSLSSARPTGARQLLGFGDVPRLDLASMHVPRWRETG